VSALELRKGLGPYPPSRCRLEPTIRRFALHWTFFDPGFSGRIKLSMIPSLLQQMPKPLGFGKTTKLQELSPLQRRRLVAIITELQVTAWLSEGEKREHHDSLVGMIAHLCLAAYHRVVVLWGRVRQLARSKKSKKRKARRAEIEARRKKEEEEEMSAVVGDRHWIMNAGKLATTYYPRGRVDPFWLGIGSGDFVTWEQVCVAVVNHMVPDVVPDERKGPRAFLARAIEASVAADNITQFCRFWMSAEYRREMQKMKRQKLKHNSKRLQPRKLQQQRRRNQK
jgi:hypothetical protein